MQLGSQLEQVSRGAPSITGCRYTQIHTHPRPDGAAGPSARPVTRKVTRPHFLPVNNRHVDLMEVCLSKHLLNQNRVES